MSELGLQLARLIAEGESERFEIKAVLPPPSTVARILASMANTDGGIFVLGMTDRGRGIEVTGLSGDFYATDVTQKALSLLDHQINVNAQYITYTEKRIYVITVVKSDIPVLLNGRLFVRRGELTVEQIDQPPVTQQILDPNIEAVVRQCDVGAETCTESRASLLAHVKSVMVTINELREKIFPNDEPSTEYQSRMLMRLLFSSCVDNFETYLSNLLYEIFLSKPETLKSESTVTVREVLDCASLQEFVDYLSRKKISKLARGSVNGFLKENKHIASFRVLTSDKEAEIDRIFQIRHLYAHRNGIVDEKFLTHVAGNYALQQEHNLGLLEACQLVSFLLTISHSLDNAAIVDYSLSNT